MDITMAQHNRSTKVTLCIELAYIYITEKYEEKEL